MESGYVNFELKLPRGASVGLYARRNALPTHTNYDLMEVIKGLKDSDKGSSVRSTRALKVSFQVLCTFYKISKLVLSKMKRMQLALIISYRTFQRLVAKDSTLYMSEGHWFISLYNDFGDSQEIEFFATMSLEMTEGCPMGCNGHGECVLGRCKCESGYGGDDCSQGKKTSVVHFTWELNYTDMIRNQLYYMVENVQL